jgi:hypothetical protein
MTDGPTADTRMSIAIALERELDSDNASWFHVTETESPRWKALRIAAALRSEPRFPRMPPRCEWCRRAASVDCLLELHHRRPGAERLGNVRLLCARCRRRPYLPSSHHPGRTPSRRSR